MWLQEFFSVANSNPWEVLEVEIDDPLPGGFVQLCRVSSFPVFVSYKPARIDFGALRKGSAMEILKLVPEWKAKLWFKELRLAGVESFSSIGGLIKYVRV